MSRKAKKVTCGHANLRFSSTEHAAEVGYSGPTLRQRIAAASLSNVANKPASEEIKSWESREIFPAPLILPDDDLALDFSYPRQSLREWTHAQYRSQVTPERRTVYLAVPPLVDRDVDFVEAWTQPRGESVKKIRQPNYLDVISYLEAFYHGLPVKLLSSGTFNFTPDPDDLDRFYNVPGSTTKDPYAIGLRTSSTCKRIRTRARFHGEYTHQMNLTDLLDVAISALPDDAYALMMLVEHDLYEDEEDEFVCGRAYGGSRVAVISTARYHPGLDRKQGLERSHAWPASHCEAYLKACCDEAAPARPRKRQKSAKNRNPDDHVEKAKVDTGSSALTSPMQAAVSAHNSLSSLEASPSADILCGLWLGRVCRTVSHELGHCFGMAHCVYYACSMQGSATIIEDARQPPYLCPVDLAKVLKATSSGMKERYQALLAFCDQHNDVHLFAGYGAWIRCRLEGLGEQE